LHDIIRFYFIVRVFFVTERKESVNRPGIVGDSSI
jgi:hypothetical protein